MPWDDVVSKISKKEKSQRDEIKQIRNKYFMFRQSQEAKDLIVSLLPKEYVPLYLDALKLHPDQAPNY